MSERCETDKTPQAKANATDKFNSIARHNQRHCLFDNAATTNQAIFSAIFNSLLADDPAERFDLATKSPDKLEELQRLWAKYVAANNVIVPNRSIFEALEKQMPKRVPDDPGYPPLTYKKQFVPPNDMLAPPKQ